MRASSSGRKDYFCFFLNDSALPVLLAARQLIHTGWALLGHPLYGNYRPHQQPYRTLLLELNPSGSNKLNGIERIVPDEYSLHLIEEAINVYQSVPGLSPHEAPPAFLEDCALLDYELMRLPLEQAGWPVADLGPGIVGDSAQEILSGGNRET